MLVDNQIREEIKNGNIHINPYNEENISPAAYYFALGKTLLTPNEGQKVSVVRGPNPTYAKIDLSQNTYVIKPGEFILGQTHEELSLGNNIGMLIDGRTSIARLGLTIHKTATFIQPGHSSSIITLEIYNTGNIEIELSYKMPIAKGIFFKSSKPSDKSYNESGIYPLQKETMGADLLSFGGK
jgi:dCTP deaminase